MSAPRTEQIPTKSTVACVEAISIVSIILLYPPVTTYLLAREAYVKPERQPKNQVQEAPRYLPH